MPSWLILVLAAVVVVAGVGVPTYLRARRVRTGALEDGLRSARAHVEATRYRLDTAAADVDTAEAARLCDTAEATLASARDDRSAAACVEAEDLLVRADAELDRAGAASNGRPDPH